MRLSAAIVPPLEVREHVARVVTPPIEQADQRTSWWRRGARGQRAAASGPATPSELDAVPADRLYLPVTSFGNVTAGDVRRLVAAVRSEAVGWPAPRVWFQGGTALEFTGDENVWAMLAGDVGALRTIGTGIPSTVRALGFLVDRRQFRTWMAVGTITEHTSAPFLEAVVERLDTHSSDAWDIDHISVVRRSLDAASGDQEELEELERIPLGRR